MRLGIQHFFAAYRGHFRQTLILSFPVIIGQLGLVLMGVIDNMMIGALGYEFLSAASLANSVFFIVAVLGIGVTFALSPLVAEADAAGKHRLCGLYLRQGLWVGLVTSLLVSLLILVATWLLPLLDQPEQDVTLGTPYLHILNVSTLPMLVFLVYKQFTDGLSLTLPAMVVTLLGLGINVLLNYLLIFGHWGFPELKLNGAGYATLGSRLFMMALMMGYVLYAPRFRKYQPWQRWREWSQPIIRKIVEIGLPSGLQYFFEVGAFGGAVIIIGWIGMEARSAHQIVINLASTTYMITTGLAAGAAIRVGNALGRRDGLNLRRAGMAGIILAFVWMAIASITLILAKDILPTWYVDNPEVLAIAAQLMIIAGLFQIFDGVQAVGIGILRGIQDVRMPTLIAFVAYWIIALPVGYFLAFPLKMGVNGMWYGFVISLGFAAVMLTWRFWRMSKRIIQADQETLFAEDALIAEIGQPQATPTALK